MFGRNFRLRYGPAALLVTTIAGVSALLILTALMIPPDDMTPLADGQHDRCTFYAAEAGLEKAVSIIQDAYAKTGTPPHRLPGGTDTMNNCLITYRTVDQGKATQHRLAQGDLAGLNATVQTYAINATAVGSTENTAVSLSQLLEIARIPIFQFPLYLDTEARTAGKKANIDNTTKLLRLPLAGLEQDAHRIVERAAGNPDSYERRATLLVLDGVPYYRLHGVWQDIQAFLPAGTFAGATFYDGREGKTVHATDIDIGRLRASGYFPPNGVIYASDHRQRFSAVRLTNGARLGGSLSLFCENPVYIRGDYNTIDKRPAAVVADAVTFLSNNWNDANSGLSLSHRSANATSANLSIIGGADRPVPGDYREAVSGLLNFLENWQEQPFSMSGAVALLWQSRQAGGSLSSGDPTEHCVPPRCDCSFDADLADFGQMPPETPQFIACRRVEDQTVDGKDNTWCNITKGR